MIGCCELNLIIEDGTELGLEVEEQINVVLGEELKGELEETKKKLEETETKLIATENELENTKGELNFANQELSSTKNELTETQGELAKTKSDLEEKTDELNTFTEEVNVVKDGIAHEVNSTPNIYDDIITETTLLTEYPQKVGEAISISYENGQEYGRIVEAQRWIDITISATAEAEDVAKGKTFVDDYGKIHGGKLSIVKRMLDARDGYVSYLFNASTLASLDDYFYDYSDTENAKGEAAFMFSNTSFLKSVPLFDMGNIYSTRAMFQNATRIETIPAYDMRNITNTMDMLSNCKALTTCLLKNIKVSLQVGSGTSWGHLLTVESLIHLLGELVKTGTTNNFTVGLANIEKLASVYVRLVDITDEMRANDDLIDEKFPFEVCESTDEGALSISEYLTLKNWTIG